jgi:hypothetical protein
VAEVVRIADIKRRVIATKAKLKAKSNEGVRINARLLELLESVEKTLLQNQGEIRRLRLTGRVFAFLALASWLVTAVAVADRFHGDFIRRAFDATQPGGEPETAAAADHEGNTPQHSGLANSEPMVGSSETDQITDGPAVGAMAPEVSGPVPGKSTGQVQEVDDLIRRPDFYQGRHVLVTGSVVRVLQRYRLRSESGLETIPLGVHGLQPADRAELEAAVESAGPLGVVLARIAGQVERRTPAGFRLVASRVVLLEAQVRSPGLERDR